MTRIKLCGLTRPEDIDAANLLRPDFIGFVFAPKSRRCISPEAAARLKGMLGADIRAVGVFVREEIDIVAALLERGVIDIAQLHGGESEEYVLRLKSLTDKPVIKAFRVDTREDLRAVLDSKADHILLDNGAGGTGTAFDWSALSGFERPYFLAGGLNPDNVAEAVRRFRPYAVDVSGGIETGGRKDAKKMKAFVGAVRAASGKEG